MVGGVGGNEGGRGNRNIETEGAHLVAIFRQQWSTNRYI